MDVCLCFLSPLWLSLSLCNWKSSLAVLSWDFFLPFSIMQLQNRKTNSGNRPPNVINFVGAGGEGGEVVGGRYYYCRRKNSNQLQIPSCLVSVTVANYKWTLCYSFTSCATQRMDWGPVVQSTDGGGQKRGREAIERDKTRHEKMRLQESKQCGGRGRKKAEKGGGEVKSPARSKVHRHEGTYVLYPTNIEHDMWFTKEMKGFWPWLLSLPEPFSGKAWNCIATDQTWVTNAITHNSIIAAMLSKDTIWHCCFPPKSN